MRVNSLEPKALIYLDSTALVKKYVIEIGTDKVRALLKNDSQFLNKFTL